MAVTKDLEIPRYGTPTDHLLGWCLEAQQEGLAWLNAQKPSKAWADVITMLDNVEGDDEIRGMSATGYNKGKRIARELVATLANFRHEGETKVVWDQTLYDQAHVLTQLDQNLYKQAQIPRGFRSGLQYAVAKGTTYLWETWNPRLLGPRRGDIELVGLDAADVTFVQLPKNHDIQQAYAVIIREELPINVAKAKYRHTNRAWTESLVPDREQPGWLQKGLQKLQQFVSPALRVAGRTGPDQNSSFPTVDVYHMYTVDLSLNEGAIPIAMGPTTVAMQPATNWSYSVPALNDPIPVGIINPATGNEWTRPATWEDTLMFPFRRYTIYSKTGICYDGPAPNWHGATPLARIRFNDWPWQALGATLVGEVFTMQKGIIELMRLIEDSSAARLNPAMVYDDTLVAESWAKAFNPRKAGARAAAPLSQGKPIEFPIPPEYYNVPTFIPEWIASQEERMDYVTGVRDLVAMAKANQLPSADTLEKLFEMSGPIVQDMVRAIEEPLVQLGTWRIAYYMQFYTKERMITVTGPDGVNMETKFLPLSLMPQLKPGEQLASRPGAVRDLNIRSLGEFDYHVTESGINEIHRMTTKLFYLQLMKEGFPISPWTFAKVAQIPNFGPEPQGTNTEVERWVAWKRMQIEIEADIQVEAALRMQEIQGQLAAGGGGGAVDTAGGGTPQGGGGDEQKKQQKAGRPQTYKRAPHIEQKDQGTRSTVATS